MLEYHGQKKSVNHTIRYLKMCQGCLFPRFTVTQQTVTESERSATGKPLLGTLTRVVYRDCIYREYKVERSAETDIQNCKLKRMRFKFYYEEAKETMTSLK